MTLQQQKTLGYGVMVTLQILVLSFLVRIRVSQPRASFFLERCFFVLGSFVDEPFPVCSSIFYVFPVFCFLIHKKAEVLGLHFGCSFLFVFGINSLNFLFYEFEIVFELLHLSVHLLYEAVSLLAGSVEEAKVVLVGGNLGAQLVEAA